MSSNFWDNFGSAVGGSDGNQGKGNYFPLATAEYDVTVESIRPHDGFNGQSIILQFKVFSSSNPDIDPGDIRDWALNLSGKNGKLALGNLKAFYCAVFGLPPESHENDQLIGAIAARAIKADNPLMGMPVHLSTFPTKTKENKDFTVHRWGAFRAEGYTPKDPRSILAIPAPFASPGPQQGYQPPGGYAPAAPAWQPPPAAPQGPPPRVYPPGLPPHFIRADGAYWNGTAWV